MQDFGSCFFPRCGIRRRREEVIRGLGEEVYAYEHADEFGEAVVPEGAADDGGGFWGSVLGAEGGGVAVGVGDKSKAGIAC